MPVPILSQAYGKLPNFSIFVTEDGCPPESPRRFQRRPDASLQLFRSCRFVEAKLDGSRSTPPEAVSNWKDMIPGAADCRLAWSIEWRSRHGARRLGQFKHRLPDRSRRSPTLTANESWNIFTRRPICRKGRDDGQRGCGTDRRHDDGLSDQEDVAFHMEGEKLEARTKPLVVEKTSQEQPLHLDRCDRDQRRASASGEIVAAYSWNDTPKTLCAEGSAGQDTPLQSPRKAIFTWFCGITMLNVGQGRSRPPPMISSMPGCRPRPAST